MTRTLIKIWMLALLCMLLFAVPLTAEAVTSGDCGEAVSWTLDDAGTLTISGTGPMLDYASYSRPGARMLKGGHSAGRNHHW